MEPLIAPLCVLPHGFQIQSGYLACTLSCLHAVILKVTTGATPAFSTNRGVHCISMYMAWLARLLSHALGFEPPTQWWAAQRCVTKSDALPTELFRRPTRQDVRRHSSRINQGRLTCYYFRVVWLPDQISVLLLTYVGVYLCLFGKADVNGGWNGGKLEVKKFGISSSVWLCYESVSMEQSALLSVLYHSCTKLN